MTASRNNFTALPTLAELEQIIQAEAPRPVPQEQQDAHYPDFSAMQKLLQILGLPDIFSWAHSFDELKNQDLLVKINNTVQELVGRVLESPQHNTAYNDVYQYLSEQDVPQKSDLLFVFGSKTEERAKTAVALYAQGLAPKILFSGGNPFYAQRNLSEAEQYQQYAVAHGVPRENTIIETHSLTIPDNVRTSLNLLDASGVYPTSIILVNSPYAQRRGWAVFKKYVPANTALYRVNCVTSDKYSRGGWYKSEDGVKVIFNEFIKMWIAVLLNTA
jgi:hypothetical protein